MNKLILLLCCTICCILSAVIPQRGSSELPMTSAGYFGGDMAGFDPKDRSAYKSLLWLKGIIPYVIDKELSNFTPLITKAIEHYSNHTCIRFIPRSTQTDYVHLINGAGCWSRIGREGGKQELSLSRGCGHLGIIIHEMMHVVGFIHEQNRPDRDDYITINLDNIVEGTEINYIKFPAEVINLLDSKYDYNSIMQYGKYAGSKNGKKVIETKPRGICISEVPIKGKLSKSDIERINKLYQC